ncbi:ADP-ribosylglycohydrolase family protein [Dendronalium sp. ChiSLP03b]|uniref:ADP-ribosylglycohydrolase family protein n=1 Tax=Dendronalium sp. ChiSLP03b TaxID=3075381 RepID=UPI002AD1E4BD|nr:ADP-ribosylglycohydrolase family protein [Dendronalium sp. ChiSLP03b]MDZ8203067.1 ADP-ribosylglycohydrolase family protein [Dendronalium sp. ChiSLP03b]
MSKTNDTRLLCAQCSLEGLSVGDAFGERFFLHPNVVESLVAARAIPASPWYYTDDTQMALSIVAILREYGEINQDKLAESFAKQYDSQRGYGPAMQGLLMQIREGEPWQQVASSLFGGQGSYGNGAAMRVAPIGAFFAEDLDLVISQARASAEITHTHPEAIAGAIAVAVAAAWAWRLKNSLPSKEEFLNLVLPYVPESEVSSKIRLARDLADTPVPSAAAVLGNGTHVSAQDTVPFALWCAAQHLDRYEEALWLTVSGLGDRDTTCAIAGGIVALSTGGEGIPTTWLQAREPLPSWDAETITLYRPTGPKELALIRKSGNHEFPPRLPEQPIFYPVLNEEYAMQIARNWNAASVDTGYIGYVTRFQVRADFLSRYSVKTVGGSIHQEYWIPAEDLPEFNRNIVGLIEVVAKFHLSTD